MEIKELTIIMLPSEVAFSFKIDPNPPQGFSCHKENSRISVFFGRFFEIGKRLKNFSPPSGNKKQTQGSQHYS